MHFQLWAEWITPYLTAFGSGSNTWQFLVQAVIPVYIYFICIKPTSSEQCFWQLWLCNFIFKIGDLLLCFIFIWIHPLLESFSLVGVLPLLESFTLVGVLIILISKNEMNETWSGFHCFSSKGNLHKGNKIDNNRSFPAEQYTSGIYQ